ncbi:MAG: SpoIIE family protein phosphatase [Clostridiaceae bacterium]|nr:SpoIIE family protein phosphatase [Clostridiaceae bacterium]
MTRIYPDTLEKLEIQSGQSEDHWQVYSITDGMGGSGIGDLSGRMVQETLIQEVASLGELDPQTFDVANFSYQFMASAKDKMTERLARYKDQEVGCSLAFLLINGSVAYTMSVGTNRIYLIRDQMIYSMVKEHRAVTDGIAKPLKYFGYNPSNPELEPENLNKLILKSDDIILLVSDGIYDLLSDKEILDLSLSDSSLVEVINNFHDCLNEKQINDDSTILGLKVLESNSIQITEHLSTDRPTEPIDISEVRKTAWEEFDYLSEEEYSEGIDSNYFDTYADYSDTEYFPDDYEIEKEIPSKSKLIQGIILFLKRYGIGIVIGVVLVFLFWLIYLRG